MNQFLEITELPIDIAAVSASVADENCGASVVFLGTTRRWTISAKQNLMSETAPVQRLETSHLIYEAYREMALAKLSELAIEAARRWPVHKVSIVHRVGRVDPVEPSVVIAVSTPHRREAFEAGQWLIDSVKHEVPIWKQEHYVQGEKMWIHPTSGSCSCTHELHDAANNDSRADF
jgi:molybdopterin synthase catalytic subunit